MGISRLEQKYYFEKHNWVDGTSEYHELLNGYISSVDAAVLEIGPGPENPSTTHVASRVICLDGLDIDERVLSNPALRRAFVYGGRQFPKEIEDESYDLVFADYVMEHVEQPRMMLGEVYRVLRPGGCFVFRTPNIYHYVSLIARCTPHSFHTAWAHKARRRDGHEIDPYPTFFRFNSRRTIRKIALGAGLREIEMRMVEKQPSYLRFHSLAYLCGIGYERAVNSTPLLRSLRANIFAVMCKDKD